VTQQACPNGPAIARPLKSLLTLYAGGTMTETTDNPMFPGVPGTGAWRVESHRPPHLQRGLNGFRDGERHAREDREDQPDD
jgi:hypothetical protein